MMWSHGDNYRLLGSNQEMFHINRNNGLLGICLLQERERTQNPLCHVVLFVASGLIGSAQRENPLLTARLFGTDTTQTLFKSAG